MTTVSKPRRGGMHPKLGVYVGGSRLNAVYQLASKSNFKFSTQCRGETKILSLIESTLQTKRNDTTAIKFNGCLDVTQSITELNKEEFQTNVKEAIRHYGLQSFFYMPHNGTMHHLADDYHMFTLEDIIAEHDSRLDEPATILDGNGVETKESILAKFRCYDEWEICDVALSRLMVESLVSPGLRQKVATRYDHLDDFDDFPGQVYLKMVMEVCHASVSLDISASEARLLDIKLSEFPGENVADFISEVLRLLKILLTGYSIHYQWSTRIIRKVTETNSPYFNRTMWVLYDNAKRMEDSWGPQRDSAKMSMECKDYDLYGPIAACANISKEYGEQVKRNEWKALEPKLPQGNLGETVPPISNEHKQEEVIPPPSKMSLGDKNNGNQGDRGSSTWRYFVVPTDENAIFTDGKITWKYCAKCWNRRAKRTGIWTMTHSTSEHTGKPKNHTSKESSGQQDETKKETVQSGDKPSGYHTPTNSASSSTGAQKKTVTFKDEDKVVDPDPDGLIFDDPEFYLAGIHQADCNLHSMRIQDGSLLPEFCVTAVESNDKAAIFDYFSGSSSMPTLFDNDAFFDALVTTDDVSTLDTSIPHEVFYDCVDSDIDEFFDAYDEILFRDSYTPVCCGDPPRGGSFSFYWAIFGLQWIVLYGFHVVATFLFVLERGVSGVVLWLSMIFWDTVELVLQPSPSGLGLRRRVLRLCGRSGLTDCTYLRGFPRSWVILNAFMWDPSVFVSIHPFSRFLYLLSVSVARIVRLDQLVALSFGVVVQYTCLRLRAVRTLLLGARDGEAFQESGSSSGLPSSPVVDDDNCSLFYDAVSSLDAFPRGDDCDFDMEHFKTSYFDMEHFKTSSVGDDFDITSTSINHRSSVYRMLSWILQVGSLIWCCIHNRSTSVNGMFDFTDLTLPCIDVGLSDISWDVATDIGTVHKAAFTASKYMGEVDLLSQVKSQVFPVIFDSGATLAITPNKQDFVGAIRPLAVATQLGGLANGIQIEGIGLVKWSIKSKAKTVIVSSMCYYVPKANARLISPQRLFNKKKGLTGRFTCMEEHAELTYDGIGALRIDYNDGNFLPTSYARNANHTAGMDIRQDIQGNLAVLNVENQNLTPSQKCLLHWHCRFGHKRMQSIQQLFRGVTNPFHSEGFKAASRCSIPKCITCLYSKAHRRPTGGNKCSTNDMSDGSLKRNILRPGETISVDHFESRLKGRTWTSTGSGSADTFKGGCIFVDHMSGYVHVEHQLGFAASETIRAKHDFEKLALDHGVIIQRYLADNGSFKAREFVKHIHEQNQRINFCGVNAHHQNGIAERNIRTVSECARAMLLHASFHWKDGIDSSLWPMAVSYACYLHNNLPNKSGITPTELFTGEQVPRHKLRDIHTWGCPVYVLDPKLQQGEKLPRWEPRARQGIFVGFSPVHSSDVPLVLNPRTGYITPQFHVVFDDEFSTVHSLAAGAEVPEFWSQLALDEGFRYARTSQIPLDVNIDAPLDETWLTADERDARNKSILRADKVRGAGDVYKRLGQVGPTLRPLSHATDRGEAFRGENLSVSQPSDDLTLQNPSPHPITPSDATTESTHSLSAQPTAPSSTPSLSAQPTAPPDTSAPLRRSQRSTQGKKPERYSEAYLSQFSSNDDPCDNYSLDLAYSADLETDLSTGVINCNDPRAYAAKTKHNPDMPSYFEATRGEHAAEYHAAMKKEITQLIKQSTWEYIPRSELPCQNNGRKHPVLPGTWAFKLKRLPDGTPLKYKARYCARGDKQTYGVDYFDTYAPVVQWSSVRLLLTLTLTKNWVTKQVDYTNAFAQANLKETVFIEPPKGFKFGDTKDKVLRLIKSLYGLKQAPVQFFEKLRTGLIERGFTQSKLDPCLFLKENMICVVYVDDTIIAGPDADKIEELITDLGVAGEEKRHTFELRDEGEVGDFLGIRIERDSNGFHLSQPGLINKAIEETGMQDCNATKTPASTVPLHMDANGERFDEKWEYSVVVGMLMYLATNSRPDIAYAVNQCARFTHCPRQSHGLAVKRIIRYLQGTKSKGMRINPKGPPRVDCYVDADFAGLWKSEDSQDPTSVKSRSGYLIMFMGCPLVWLSKLQSQIALSTRQNTLPYQLQCARLLRSEKSSKRSTPSLYHVHLKVIQILNIKPYPKHSIQFQRPSFMKIMKHV